MCLTGKSSRRSLCFLFAISCLGCFTGLRFQTQLYEMTHTHTDLKAKLGVTVCVRVRDQAATGTSDACLIWNTRVHVHSRTMTMCVAWPFLLTPATEKNCPTAAAHIILECLVWTWQLIPVFHSALFTDLDSHVPEFVNMTHSFSTQYKFDYSIYFTFISFTSIILTCSHLSMDCFFSISYRFIIISVLTGNRCNVCLTEKDLGLNPPVPLCVEFTYASMSAWAFSRHSSSSYSPNTCALVTWWL